MPAGHVKGVVFVVALGSSCDRVLVVIMLLPEIVRLSSPLDAAVLESTSASCRKPYVHRRRISFSHAGQMLSDSSINLTLIPRRVGPTVHVRMMESFSGEIILQAIQTHRLED